MAYIINRFNGEQLTIVDDGALDNTTSLGLIGRNYTGYGETQNENYVFLLENFSNASPPARALSGQVWYDSTAKTLKVYNGTSWLAIGNATVAETAPAHSIGGLWFNTATQQVFISDGTTWRLVGPEGVAGFAVTKLTSTTLKDTLGNLVPVILTQINGETTAIHSAQDFTISGETSVPGFTTVNKGTTLKSTHALTGNVTGNADTATALETTRTINNVDFDGTENIVIKSSTTNILKVGDYLTGSNWDGTIEDTWGVDATPENIIGTVVARDSNGGFSAGPISANLLGDVTGNVTAYQGTSSFVRIVAPEIVGSTFSGNSASATKLQTARTINTVFFDGTTDITLPVPAETLVGSELAPNVLTSSLTEVGKLVGLETEATGIVIGDGNTMRIQIEGFTPTIVSETTNVLRLKLQTGAALTGTSAAISYISAATAATDGGVLAPALVPDYTDSVPIVNRASLGLPSYKWGRAFIDSVNASAITTSTIAGPNNGAVVFGSSINVPGTIGGNVVGNLTGNVQGNVVGSVTGAASLNMLKTGDSLSGDITWTATNKGLSWSMNSDGASIKFYNTSDSDLNSRLEFNTTDNNNEFFRWTHTPNGGSTYESMRLTPNIDGAAQLTVTGNITATGTVFATLRGQGNQITNLNASELGTGIVPSLRLSGTYNISVSGNAATVSSITRNQVIGAIGYNPANLAGDTFTGNLNIVKDNAWLTLDSPSINSNGEYQAAGISIGESGYKGSASFHITYTGDGYSHIGMGPVDQSTSIPAYRAMRMYYLSNTVDFYGQINVPTVNATTLIGSGASITSLNASNISSGTLAVGRLAGSYNINVTGNASTANTATVATSNILRAGDTMSGRLGQSASGFHAASAENIANRTNSGFFETSTPTTAEGWPVNGSWHHLLSSTHTNDANYFAMQLSADFYSQNLYYRSTAGSGSTTWNRVLLSSNYNDYVPTKTGTGASGTWPINVTGNAATVTSITGNQVINALGFTPTNSQATPTYVVNSGTISAEGNGTGEPSSRLTLRSVYNNGYPTQYGNVITLGGSGGGELLVGWSGSTGAHAENYVRSRRDTGNTWSPWARLVTDQNIAGIVSSIGLGFTVTSGNTWYTNGFTNHVGTWRNDYNWFDVYPPSGKTMAKLLGFIPSIAVIHYAGGVNGDDSMRCTWSNLGDRIRVYVQNTEQRSTPAANWLAIWGN